MDKLDPSVTALTGDLVYSWTIKKGEIQTRKVIWFIRNIRKAPGFVEQVSRDGIFGEFGMLRKKSFPVDRKSVV